MTLWRVGLLALVTSLIWVAHYERWTLESWKNPTNYSGDSHEVLARIKAASEGASRPLQPEVIDRLGAPFGADWSAYPTPDKPLFMLLGALANVVGLFAAANVGLLGAQISAALAFYLAARWMRCRWEWAWAGALLFAYTYQTFHRGLPHLSFVFTWTIPLGLLAVWLIAQSRRLEWGSWGTIICLLAAVGMGISTPYNLLFWGQLLIWAMITQWIGRRRKANLQIGLVTGAAALLAFFITNGEVWLHTKEPDGLPLLSRNYSGTERYALKPVEMFIPPQYHRWDMFAFFGQRYSRWADWRGEAYLPYLGLVGIAGLIWLVGLSVQRLITRRPIPGQALSLSWLLSYATVGGLTNILAFFLGWQIFRATNRVAIFISAIVLLFLMLRLSRQAMRWPVGWSVAAALGVALLGVLDQVPRHGPRGLDEQIALEVRSDRELGRQLEAALPKGALVFQLPVLGFPEVTPPSRLVDYELFRPYLVTEGLRFSYGAAKFRSQSRWQRDLEALPVEPLVRRLEQYGFAALYINRRGYEDRAEQLLNELETLGYTRRLQSMRGNQVVIFLAPTSKPVPPLARVMTYGRGWHPRPEDGVRWAAEDAALAYFNPFNRPIVASLRFEILGVSRREVTLHHNGSAVASIRTDETPVKLEVGDVLLKPGVNTFHLRSQEPARRLSGGRYQLRSFGLKSAAIRVMIDGGEGWSD